MRIFRPNSYGSTEFHAGFKFHGMKEDLKAEVKKKPTETGALIVTNLDMVSDSCN